MTPADIVEEQHKSVYAHFGAVAARVSAFESVLINILLGAAKKTGKITTDKEFDRLEKDLRESKTLGPLIKSVNARITVPKLTEEAMSEALKRRNYLMHHFFRDKAFEFETEAGRSKLLKELIEAHAYILVAKRLANELLMQIANEFGIGIADIEAQVENLRRKARETEKSGNESLERPPTN
jgi:hypothetical protein